MRRLLPLLLVVFVISLRAEGLPESIVFVNQGKYQDPGPARDGREVERIAGR